MSVSYPVTFRSNRFYGLVEQQGPFLPAPVDKQRSTEMTNDSFNPSGVDTWTIVKSPQTVKPLEPTINPIVKKKIRNANVWRKVVEQVGNRLFEKITTGFNNGKPSEPTLQELGLEESFKNDLVKSLVDTMDIDSAKAISEIVTDVGVTPTDADMIFSDEGTEIISTADPSPSTSFFETVQRALSSFATPQQLEDTIREAIAVEQVPIVEEEIIPFEKPVFPEIVSGEEIEFMNKRKTIKRKPVKQGGGPVKKIRLSTKSVKTVSPKAEEPVATKKNPGLKINTRVPGKRKKMATPQKVKQKKKPGFKINTSVPKVKGPKVRKSKVSKKMDEFIP
jgi:hypothetical protein